MPEIQVNDHQMQGVKSYPNKKRVPVRICPPLPESMIQVDFDLCKMLIRDVLDPEKEVDSWIVDEIDDYPL